MVKHETYRMSNCIHFAVFDKRKIYLTNEVEKKQRILGAVLKHETYHMINCLHFAVFDRRKDISN